MVERKRIAHEALMNNNQKLLFDMLDSFDGPKIIVWDPALIKRFNMVATAEQLKEHRVVSMLQLELLPGVPQAEHNHVLYILSGDKSSVKKLVTCLKHAHSVNVSIRSYMLARWIDPLTPLLIQLTYAGLVDELLDMGPTGNIRASKLKRADDAGDATAEVPLHDSLFRTIRDLHMKDVGKQIGEKLGELRDERMVSFHK
ncbi:unnamed protein product [Gongylonema pulchrum]|uniref:Utp12 domain-containing protein n=1 Tax=Gongylonema pulchrum TaxID=637853 RepID=A0A183E7C0_9BILA|nr:unnamed protein product [Gongylonema pulchrum]